MGIAIGIFVILVLLIFAVWVIKQSISDNKKVAKPIPSDPCGDDYMRIIAHMHQAKHPDKLFALKPFIDLYETDYGNTSIGKDNLNTIKNIYNSLMADLSVMLPHSVNDKGELIQDQNIFGADQTK